MLYNVTAIFEADSIQRTETYVGNIEPGKSGDVDAMIAGIAPTVDEGKILLTITYEDENGIVTPVEKEVSLFVTEPQELEPVFEGGDIDFVEPEPSFREKYEKYMLPAGAGAAALLTVIVIVVKRRKKKAGMDDEIL